ncbi:MAG: adenosine deaminase [Rhodospirillaceae bacterium]|jgi:adenosine deaminase|nr:adenosine deaminase [Rhodospirillaceae bacterium]MBT6116381.1 adenosine deaminase [Rhodospirillaceae bacterium]
MANTLPDRIPALVQALLKAELHLHIEGTLEPELAFAMAKRNGVALRFDSVEALRAAYDFDDLQSFLDLYYEIASVLRTERDFHDLAAAYLERMAAENVRHVEIFFDPQTHTARGVAYEAVLDGLSAALAEAEAARGITGRLILSFLRDRSAEEAMATLEAALPRLDRIAAVGLDSAERGNPPAKFEAVFARARAEGLVAVAHAGEEGPPAYIREALDRLHVARIDHGVRCEEDPNLVARLRIEQVPLTVCPLSNVRLRVFDSLADHNLKRLLDAGLLVTINSDDPAYFGGYLSTNYVETQRALALEEADLVTLAKNGFTASLLPAEAKAVHLAAVDHAYEDFLVTQDPHRLP